MIKKIRVAITMGDPQGIGPEVCVKALNTLARRQDIELVIVGDGYCLKHYGLKASANVTVLDLNNIGPRRFKPGSSSAISGKASMAYLAEAVTLIKKGRVDCLVTAPISKDAVRKGGFLWPGHTEYLAHTFGVKRVEMVFVSKGLKVVVVTRHVSLKEAIAELKQKKIFDCGCLVMDFLERYFKIKNPRIAVCGLNPHAGEAGRFGKEESTQIAPAVAALNKRKARCFFGPLSADTVFYQALKGEFDLVMAMYHDQGLIPFKMLEFDQGVHLTVGLPFIRTSPVHGTALDIAGKNRARERSMVEAILLAGQLARNDRR